MDRHFTGRSNRLICFQAFGHKNINPDHKPYRIITMKKSLYIITGCSKGLGKALTELWVQNPENHVVGISRSEMEDMENFVHIRIDLGNIDSLIDSLDRIFPTGEFENIVMINNAGWIGEIAPMGKLDPKGIQAIHSINVIAPAILMNEFVKQYAASKA
jgi:benzil reductase ((S)-benzoin forming)